MNYDKATKFRKILNKIKDFFIMLIALILLIIICILTVILFFVFIIMFMVAVFSPVIVMVWLYTH